MILRKKILNYILIKKNIKHLFIKQGYSRCSMLVFNEYILTSDMGIFKKLKIIFQLFY